MRDLRFDEAASGTVTSFIVGLSIFVLAFSVVTVFVSVQVQGDAETTDDAIDLTARAQSVLRSMTTTPGTPADWQSHTPALLPARFGLLKTGTTTTLDVEKFRDLNEDLNSVNDYETVVKPLLGLEGYDFHLRAYPVLRTDANGNVSALREYRVAYVGQHVGVYPTYAEVPGTAGVEGPLLATAGIPYSNKPADHEGASAGAFRAGDRFADDGRALTRLLALRLAGFPYATDQSTPTGNQSYWKIVNLARFNADDEKYIPASQYPASGNVLTASNREWSGSKAKWAYTKSANPATPTVDRVVLGTIDLTAFPEGVSGAWLNLSHHVSGKHTGTPLEQDIARVTYWCDVGCSSTAWTTIPTAEWNELPADYKKGDPFWQATTVDLAPLLGKRVWVALSWEAGFGSSVKEGWFVKDLRVDASTFGRSTRLYENGLDYRATLYDAILVGSDVAQANLNDAGSGSSSAFRHVLHDWIAAGGDLAAFGSLTLKNEWLAPTFTVPGAPGVAGQLWLNAPDTTHPVLTSPHNLQYRAYSLPTIPQTYEVSDNLFTKVLLKDRVGATGEVPTLAVSNPNQDWRGTVVLTSYQPNLIAPAGTEAHDFLVNILSYMRYDVLYLDWGGTIPGGAAVGSASRTMLVDGTPYRLGASDAFIVLYVWR